jgi:nicotinamidase-related amidase
MPGEFPALLIIDTVKDNFDPKKPLPITREAKRIIQPINTTTATFRKNAWPVIFARTRSTPTILFSKGR